MQRSCFSLNLHAQHLVNLANNYYCGVLVLTLYFPHCFYIHRLELCKEGISLFSIRYLFNYVLTPGCWTHGYLFYPVGSNPVLHLFLLFKLFPAWPSGALSCRPLCPCNTSCPPLSTSLSSNTECSRSTLYFLCLRPGVNHFLRVLTNMKIIIQT